MVADTPTHLERELMQNAIGMTSAIKRTVISTLSNSHDSLLASAKMIKRRKGSDKLRQLIISLKSRPLCKCDKASS